MDKTDGSDKDQAMPAVPIADIDLPFDSVKKRRWFVVYTVVVGICTSFALGTMSGMGFDRTLQGDEIVRNPTTQRIILLVYAIAGITGFFLLNEIAKRGSRRSVLKAAFIFTIALWSVWSIAFGIYMPSGGKAWHDRAMFIFSGLAIGAVAASGTLTMMDRLGTIFFPAASKRGDG